MPCPKLSYLLNAVVNDVATRPGESVYIECYHGYNLIREGSVLQPSMHLVCLEGGTWNESVSGCYGRYIHFRSIEIHYMEMVRLNYLKQLAPFHECL